ncbi:MAG: hypothetical protein ACLRPR_01035 [Eisenbergiella sp.]
MSRTDSIFPKIPSTAEAEFLMTALSLGQSVFGKTRFKRSPDTAQNAVTDRPGRSRKNESESGMIPARPGKRRLTRQAGHVRTRFRHAFAPKGQGQEWGFF